MAVEIPYDLDRLRFMPVGKSRAFVRRFGTVLLERLTGGFYLTTNGEYTWSLSDEEFTTSDVLRMIDFAIRLGNLQHDCPILKSFDYERFSRGIVGAYETVVELIPHHDGDIEYSFGVSCHCLENNIFTELFHHYLDPDGFECDVSDLGDVWASMGLIKRGLNLHGSAMDWIVAITDHHVDPMLAQVGHNLEAIERAFRRINTDVLDWRTV